MKLAGEGGQIDIIGKGEPRLRQEVLPQRAALRKIGHREFEPGHLPIALNALGLPHPFAGQNHEIGVVQHMPKRGGA